MKNKKNKTILVTFHFAISRQKGHKKRFTFFTSPNNINRLFHLFRVKRHG